MHIFKTLRKVLVERTCSISLSGLSIVLSVLICSSWWGSLWLGIFIFINILTALSCRKSYPFMKSLSGFFSIMRLLLSLLNLLINLTWGLFWKSNPLTNGSFIFLINCWFCFLSGCQKIFMIILRLPFMQKLWLKKIYLIFSPTLIHILGFRFILLMC